ncbi:diaminobutyrate acetyltransferase [Segniliparus rugosus]|uniref:L-2,4-diaminobutyric acid acetyltransferase n=1 Tax=Segniliparus rugosus (strain ATCC BAA-974 / DSM 45345 / CCUG 50838 / CIP 108380 / JCM 13579 / CDC 945) TaxID=679197 RepID=E5XTK4_SEGRC|nr:diaminobutyrate acetyltransferase [Segniliparus rugosus]EFV12319.1 diaminobutyrate acetyltransferase [Segniliparus rugosus ATCC BAA-974]
MGELKAAPSVTLRPPQPEDGPAMHRLAASSETLDVNTRYAYVLLAHHFSATSAIAENSSGPVGFATGYHPPGRPDVLFVWQICVAAQARGQGVGAAMLDWLVDRADRDIVVEATVAPSNAASNAMFGALARRRNTTLAISDGFPASLFPAPHEAEPLVRVGPITSKP